MIWYVCLFGCIDGERNNQETIERLSTFWDDHCEMRLMLPSCVCYIITASNDNWEQHKWVCCSKRSPSILPLSFSSHSLDPISCDVGEEKCSQDAGFGLIQRYQLLRQSIKTISNGTSNINLERRFAVITKNWMWLREDDEKFIRTTTTPTTRKRREREKKSRVDVCGKTKAWESIKSRTSSLQRGESWEAETLRLCLVLARQIYLQFNFLARMKDFIGQHETVLMWYEAEQVECVLGSFEGIEGNVEESWDRWF